MGITKRPNTKQIELRGIVPKGYFEQEQNKKDEELESVQDPKVEQVVAEKVEIVETKTKQNESVDVEEVNTLKMEIVAKDRKIEELMAEIERLKNEKNGEVVPGESQTEIDREELIENEPTHRYSTSYTKFSVQNEIHSKYMGQIEAVKSEYNKLLNAMKDQYGSLERKYLDSTKRMKDAKTSKLALLKIFNVEMDRMREEIKRQNGGKMITIK